MSDTKDKVWECYRHGPTTAVITVRIGDADSPRLTRNYCTECLIECVDKLGVREVYPPRKPQ